MSERSERIAKFVQILVYAAADGDGPPIMPRMYRSVLLDALAENRKALPRDLGALSLVLQAAELFGQGLYFARGTTREKAFTGDGYHALLHWLLRCTGLFARVDEVYDDLPPMPETAGDVRAAAKAYAIQCDHLYTRIAAHAEKISEEADDDDDGDDAEPEQPTVHLDGRILKDFVTALAVVMCAWFDKSRTLRVMEAVNEGSEELQNCREILEDTSEKGNA